ncbi:MAG: tetratricopeptide repeat protein [Agriterribacter sp.]
MRYVPNLIPENSKVLPDYFKGNLYKAAKKNPLRDTILWIIGVFFLIGALVSIKHPLMTLIFGLIGLILIPPGHQFIERKLKFRFAPKIKVITALALFIGSMPLANHYADVDQQISHQQKLAVEEAAKEKAIADQKEQQRKDSLVFYINQGNRLAKEHKIDEANKQLQYATAFAFLPIDKEQIEKEKTGITVIKILDLIKARKYQAALPEINELLNLDPSNSELIYNRAICYSKTGKIHEAVNDLKPLVHSGNTEAEKLYNKINPIRKRVAYYITRCCDGTTSNATGRGACSHHGGVCNWNEPVYEEYRKYE